LDTQHERYRKNTKRKYTKTKKAAKRVKRKYSKRR
jgi:hypothetical protein